MMATCGIWKISSNLEQVIKYVSNPEKTLIEDNLVNELHKTINYATNDDKTELGHYVSGINCSVKYAPDEMNIVKESFGKVDGILGYHAFQSFKEGEVTPEQAHRIGVQLAEEMWGDRFQVIVATHLNTENYHNHFVINSVSFIDGKKCEYSRTSYAELRKLNDSICLENGLSVLEEKPTRKHINFANYVNKNNIDRVNYYSITKKDIDYAIKEAVSYKDFLELLKHMNYSVYERYGKLSVKRNNYKRNIRIERYFGEEYSIDRIKERIDISSREDLSYLEEEYRKEYHIEARSKKKYHGLFGLYRYYCYLLKIYPTNIRKYKLSPAMRLDILEMDRISEETVLLVRENIISDEQLNRYKNKLCKQVDNLLDSRNKLWYHYKTVNSNDKIKTNIKEKINSITEELKPLRKELKLCLSIEQRKDKMEANLKGFQEREEVNRNESIR